MTSSRLCKIGLVGAILAVLVFPSLRSAAQSGVFSVKNENLEEICQPGNIAKSEKSLSREDYQALLEKCLKYYEEAGEQLGQKMGETKQKEKTLQNEIYYLKNKIAKLDNEIYQSNLMVKDLGFQVSDAETSIEKTSLKIEDSKKKLADILRTIYEEQQKSLVEVLFSEDELSDFFDNLAALEVLNNKNQELLDNIKELKTNMEGQKKSLNDKKKDVEDLLTIQVLQKKDKQSAKKDQEYFLSMSKAEYQKYLEQKKLSEKMAADIRARIFQLVGVPKAPTFGEAYQVAKYVENITHVRSAFLLAILTQESNIGRNVGMCYLKNPLDGEGIVIESGKKISKVMKPMGLRGRKGDVDDFLKITKELGRDPYNTLVSCPMSYGWGGAMGPAQFIPTTWVLYKDKLKSIIGRPADPWNIKDSFLASGLYLAELGASQQTADSEWISAMRYFSGTAQRTRYNGYGFYGDRVSKITKQYESDIRTMENN